MNNKRITTDIDGHFLIEKITYEEWCKNLTVSSYFVPNTVMDQIVKFYPETLMNV